MTQRSTLAWRWLAPRRPNYAVFLWIVVPTNVALVLAIGLTSGIASSQVLDHLLGGLFLATVGGALALAVSIVATLLIPRRIFHRSLWLAVAAAYGPYTGGAYLGVSLAVWTRSYLPFGLDPLDQLTTISLMVGFVLVWFWLGLLSNHLAEALDRRLAYEKELAAKVDELEESRRRVVFVQERLRREIASQLHGRVQGNLWVIIHRLRESSRSISQLQGELPSLDEPIQDLEKLNGTELREISHQLHPALIKMGLHLALSSLRERFGAVMPVTLHVDEAIEQIESLDGQRLSPELRLAIYRIAEEALSNVSKHSAANRVELSLVQTQEGRIVISIRDDGRGFDADRASGGLGVLSMQDYCGTVGGTLQINSARGEGTVVAASFPIVLGDEKPASPVFTAPVNANGVTEAASA